MANKIFWMGILVMMVLIFGVQFSGCASDSRLNGTWVDDEKGMEWKLKNGKAEIFSDGELILKGNYTTKAEKMSFSITQFSGSAFGLDSEWYTRKELETMGITDEHLPLMLRTTVTVAIVIEKNILTINTDDGYKFTLTKR